MMFVAESAARLRSTGDGREPATRRLPPTVPALLSFFAFVGLAIGAWQLVAPNSFYSDFPGFGRHWVSLDGAYNEHLLRNVGQANLALGIVALYAVLNGGVHLARAAGLAVAVANAAHQLYHQTHLHVLPETDRLPQTVTLTAVTLLSLWLAIAAFRLPSSTAPGEFRFGALPVTVLAGLKHDRPRIHPGPRRPGQCGVLRRRAGSARWQADPGLR